MGAVEGLLLLLLLGGVAPLLGAASWHTLHYLKVAFWERGRHIPHFTSSAYVDDHLVGRYDRSTHQCVPQSSWIEDIKHDDTNFWARSTGRHFGSNLIPDLLMLKDLYNQSRDPPTVRVARQAGSDGLETLVCRLHGFYPKEIDVTWWKDGEDQKSDTWVGGVVPNSDGTYNIWLTIDIDPQERDRYWCHVEHDSLSEPQDLALQEPASAFQVWLIVGALLGIMAVLFLLGARVILAAKKRREGSYQGAPTSDQGSESSASA